MESYLTLVKKNIADSVRGLGVEGLWGFSGFRRARVFGAWGLGLQGLRRETPGLQFGM